MAMSYGHENGTTSNQKCGTFIGVLVVVDGDIQVDDVLN
jgi:hypothetical protein